MQISTTFRQMGSSPALREYAESKIGRLEKYHNGIIEARVTFASGKTSQTAEVTVKASGFTVRGEESAKDAYAALDMVIDKLSRQLKKHHDREKDHRDDAPRALNAKKEAGEPAARGDRSAPAIVKRSTYSLKPLFSDDAIAAMEQTKDDFMLFVNAETSAVTAIYRRADGNFGLVEPD